MEKLSKAVINLKKYFPLDTNYQILLIRTIRPDYKGSSSFYSMSDPVEPIFGAARSSLELYR